MLNDIFSDQVERNMEVYVDEIILKSRKVKMLSGDMKETFSRFARLACI